MVGGYGRDSVLNRFVTFPVVSKIQVDSIINAVITQVSLAPFIKQVSDTNLRVCGGEMHEFNNKFYLMFGHDFNGRYANPFAPIYTQYYRTEIKQFDIVETGGNLQIANYSVMASDTNNFHRRDLNVTPLVKPDGSFALMAHGGVFQKQHDFPYFEPIYIDNNSATVLPYQQVMSHYTCAHLPVFDTVSKKMHTVFFGGMSFNDFIPPGNTVVQDTLVPFISDVTCFTVKPGNVCEEAVLPVQMPGLLGSNAKFIPNKNLSWFSNGVLNLNYISGKTLAGYMLGGIRAEQANEGVSIANDTIYRIYIEIDSTTSLQKVNEEFTFFDVFPNPANNKVFVQFQLKQDADIRLSLFDVNGKELINSTKAKCKKGKAQHIIDVAELPNGIYIIKCISNNSSINRKVIVKH